LLWPPVNPEAQEIIIFSFTIKLYIIRSTVLIWSSALIWSPVPQLFVRRLLFDRQLSVWVTASIDSHGNSSNLPEQWCSDFHERRREISLVWHWGIGFRHSCTLWTCVTVANNSRWYLKDTLPKLWSFNSPHSRFQPAYSYRMEQNFHTQLTECSLIKETKNITCSLKNKHFFPLKLVDMRW